MKAAQLFENWFFAASALVERDASFEAMGWDRAFKMQSDSTNSLRKECLAWALDPGPLVRFRRFVFDSHEDGSAGKEWERKQRNLYRDGLDLVATLRDARGRTRCEEKATPEKLQEHERAEAGSTAATDAGSRDADIVGQPQVFRRDENASSPPESKSAAGEQEHFIFRREGDMWTVAFGSHKRSGILNRRGMLYLHTLLANPNKAISAQELFNLGAIDPHAGESAQTPQPLFDEDAKAEIKLEIEEIKEERLAAEGRGDIDRVKELEQELKGIGDQFKEGARLGKSPARSTAHAVRMALERAYERLEKQDLKEAVAYFRATVRPEEYAYAYRPKEPAPPWEL